MRYLSVCSGIEAASVAFEPLGWKPLAFAEIEAFPRAVLQHHYPDVPLFGDFTALRHEPWIVDADVLVGGTPCQSFSVAGLRQSLDDERGNLSLEFIRLANAIDDLRRDAGREPAFIIWENVPGVFSTKDNAFGAFLGGLVGSGAAIDVPHAGWPDAGVVAGPERHAAWRVLDAQFFGLAQRRRRVFVLAGGGARNWACADALLPIAASLRGDSAPRRETRQGVAGRVADSLTKCRAGSPDEARGTANMIPEIVGTLSDGAHMGGGLTGKTPTQAASLPSVSLCLNAGAMGRIDAESETLIPIGGFFDVAHSLRAEGFDASEDGTVRGTPLIAFSVKDHGADAGPLSPTLRHGGANGGQPAAIAFDARQSDVLQYGEKTGPLDTDGHTMGVLAFDWKMGEKARSVACSVDQSPTLGAQADRYAIASAMQVRRLTPRECERLQGFADDYTLIPYRGKPAADGPRYKALGNSFAVPVVRWIGRRIQEVEDLCSSAKSA